MALPWEAERVVDAGLARRLIREQMPDVPADRVEPLGQGWDNTVYRVDGDLVFRFPRRQLGADLLGTEWAVLPRIAGRLPIPISAPVRLGQPTSEFPWPFAAYAYLPGTPACRAGLSEEQRCALAEPLGRFLAALHSLPVGELAAAGLPGDTLGRMDPGRRVPQALERLHRLADAGVVASPEPWLPLLEGLPSGPRPLCLVHGDLYACHILVEAGRVTGVIDWGDVHAGDPAADLMLPFAFLPARCRDAFEAAYGAIDEPTRRLARFRGLHHTLAVLDYAHATGDANLLREGLQAMGRLLEGG